MSRLILFLPLLICCVSCGQHTGNNKETIVRDTVFAAPQANFDTTQRDTTVQQTYDRLATDHSTKERAVSPDQLILPGKRIGKTPLRMNAQQIETILGSPDKSDAAMGKAWLTWYGAKRDEHNNRTELNIYTTYSDNTMREKTVQQIRVTSSFFKTKEGVGVYNSLEEIKKSFPDLKQVARYRNDGRMIHIYDDIEKGISFDVAEAGDQLICTGITVHLPGKPVVHTYIFLYPHTELL